MAKLQTYNFSEENKYYRKNDITLSVKPVYGKKGMSV